MTRLENLWVECDDEGYKVFTAIRIDWDNGRHQRIRLSGTSPDDLIRALKDAASIIDAEQHRGEI